MANGYNRKIKIRTNMSYLNFLSKDRVMNFRLSSQRYSQLWRNREGGKWECKGDQEENQGQWNIAFQKEEQTIYG